MGVFKILNKKIFSILVIAIFLIISLGVISAADDPDDSGVEADVEKVSKSKVISVKIDWDDSGKASERPDQVKVDLIKDGAVVDTVVLDESNSWKASFKAQDDDGTFEVQQATDLNDYSTTLSGNADDGFIIKNKISEDVLSASDDEQSIQDANSTDDEVDDTETDGADDVATDDETDGADEEVADDGETDDGADADATETDDADLEDGTADDNAPTTGNVVEKKTDKDTNKKTTKSTKKPVNKEKEKKPVKKDKVPKDKYVNTGLPIMALVIVLIVVAFVPFYRKK
ncbi:Cna B-type domain-containing protein [Methanobrevibacter sp.]|uniref:Cna B-type domain-containing protein n=1 Tax=Methanobrevibacter sp. TaxID=66852 RepID=UPI00386C4CB9